MRKQDTCPICYGEGEYPWEGKKVWCPDCKGTGVKLPRDKWIDTGKMISFPPKGE